MSKNPPVAPSARNQRGFAAVTPLPAWPAPKTCAGFAVSMYIARSTRIGDVRDDARRDVGGGEARDVVDRDGQARLGGDRVRQRDRGGRRRAEVGHAHVRRRRGRVLQQVEQLEGAVRRALGEEPGRRRGRGRGLGVAAVAAAPGHDAVGDERLVRLDDRGERGREAAVRGEAARLARRDREGARPAAAVLAEEPRHHGRRRRCPGWRCRPGSGRRRCWRLRRGSACGRPSGGCRAGTPRDCWRRRRRDRPPHRRHGGFSPNSVSHALAMPSPSAIAIEDVEVGETVDVVSNHGRRLEEDVAAVRAQVAGEGERRPRRPWRIGSSRPVTASRTPMVPVITEPSTNRL